MVEPNRIIGDLAGNVDQATSSIEVTIVTNASYGYDDAGNVTDIEFNSGAYGLDLGWNAQYQLVAATNGSVVETYSYDALGRRVATVSGATTSYHVYDGIHCIADVDAQGGLVRSYTYGPGIDNILAMTVHEASETNTYYYLTDHLGSVLAITDSDGDVVESYDYDGWGRVQVYDSESMPLSASGIGNRYAFQGREVSWATGLIYFRARWYDPVTGRWLSKDPIGISGGLNQYVAFGGNPVRFSDPMGLREEWTDLENGVYDSQATPVYNTGAVIGHAIGNGMAAGVDMSGVGDVGLLFTGEDSFGNPTSRLWAAAPVGGELLGRMARWWRSSRIGARLTRWLKRFSGNECVVRSLDDLDSLRGASLDEVAGLFPPDWEVLPLKDLNGIRFIHPTNKGEAYFLNMGYEDFSDPLHGGPYLKVSRKGVKTRIPLKGNPALD